MPTPSTRTPVRVARGTYSNLNSSFSDLQEGEVCYATDQNKLYVKEGSSLIEQPGLGSAQTFTAAQTFNANVNLGTASSLVFEGSSADDYETTFSIVNPTADRTIQFADISGTVVTTGDTGTVTNTMLAGSIALTKLANLTSAQLIVGNGSNVPTAVAMSGDATLANTGALSIASDAITTAKISDSQVTYAKIQDVSATDKILGRSTSGAGVVEEISCTSAGRALLDDADASAQRATLGLVIGTDVQAFDADTAKLDTAQTFTAAQTFTPQSVHNGGILIDGPYEQKAEAVSALEIDLNDGNYFTKTINGNSTFTFANPPAANTVGSFVLELTHTSGTVTWPSEVKFPADTAPTLTTGKTHLFLFVTDDSGSRYRGAALVDYVN